MTFLHQKFLENEILDWAIAILIAISVLVILKILKSLIVNRLRALARKTETDIDDLIVDLLGRTHFFLLFMISIYAGSLVLSLPVKVSELLKGIAIISFLFQVVIWGNGLINYWTARYRKEKLGEDAASVTTVSAVGFIGKLVLSSVILLIALQNLGVDVNALIAGLGIGGIAVALALQNVLGDLFASISIVLDKPFVLGDFIIVDDYKGTIEHIGLKTTRVRSLFGEQIVFSNNDLLQNRIKNYKRMFNRRIVFTLGVVYQTPYEKLKSIPSIIKDVIEAQQNTRFDRAHFNQYGDFSLNYETVYYVLSPDYNLYMDINQAINLEIFRRFEEEGIEFAYPTQTLFVEKEESGEQSAN
ncbi:mechanosensitive ion channel family protein [Desulfobacterota bacterium AH_259_B03_O07]|nr:mechanosensitive ion channel family protein [Desulfobacterota bacterium AH_259_B03_O07]